MNKLLILIVFLSGCSYWTAGINDPAVVSEAVSTATAYRELADATGVPYAGWIVGVAAVILSVFIGGRKKVGK